MGRRTEKALDATADGLHRVGVKVAGDRGARAAKTVSRAALGRHLEPCSEACGWCNATDRR